jgi:PIG-X / PBN1
VNCHAESQTRQRRFKSSERLNGSSFVTTTSIAMSEIPIHSTLNPSYGAHPTIVSSLSFSSPPECPVYLHYTLPPLLIVDIHELSLRSEHYTVLGLRGRGSRELERPVHALPLSDEPVEVMTRLHDVQNETMTVQLPVHVRYAEPLGGEMVLSFDGPRAFSSCDFDLEKPQDPWELVARHLQDSRNPPQKQELLEIPVPVGDRQGDLQVVEFGTALTILACFVWIALGAWRAHGRLAKRDGMSKKRD